MKSISRLLSASSSGAGFRSGSLRAHRKTIERFFDADWYIRQFAERAVSKEIAFEHYLDVGAGRLRSPHPLFDPGFYFEQLSGEGVARALVFARFLTLGGSEDFDPHPCFPMAWYRRTHELGAAINPWTDYLETGWRKGREPNWLFDSGYLRDSLEGRLPGGHAPLYTYLGRRKLWLGSPSALFSPRLHRREGTTREHPYVTFWRHVRDNAQYMVVDPEFYSAQIKDRRPLPILLQDYLERGEREGLQPNPLFDPRWYAQTYGVDSGAGSLLVHYLAVGSKLLHNPSPLFDTRFYLERNPLAARAGTNPLLHFLAQGQRNDANPHPLFDLTWYRDHQGLGTEDSPVQHYLSVGRGRRASPHPAILVDERAEPAHVEAALFPPPDTPRIASVGLGTVFATRSGSGSDSGAVTPCAASSPAAATIAYEFALSRRLQVRTRVTDFEPIARMYRSFDYAAARSLSQGIRARYEASPHGVLPLVSVIIPTRNRAALLGRAIQSVLVQTHGDIELIVVDDGSSDGTDELIASRFQDRRVRYIRQRAGGVGKARNTGLDAVRGEYIAFLDSDNYWEPFYLELMVKQMRLEGFRSAYSALRQFTNSGEVQYRGDVFDIEALRRENYIDLNIYLHHRSLLDTGIRFDETLRRCLDWDYILRMSRVDRPAYIPIVGCNYADNDLDPDRITTTETSGDFFAVCRRNYDFSRVLVGRPPSRTPDLSIVWPIDSDDPVSTINEVWEVVRDTARTGHELILVNNRNHALSVALDEIACRIPGVRLFNLWRTFRDFPAADIGSEVAQGRRLLFWRSGVKYDPQAVARLLASSGDHEVVVPAVVNADGVIASELARIGDGSNPLEPVLRGQPAGRTKGRAEGILSLSFPALVGTELYKQVGGFRTDFSGRYGLVDFCLRVLAETDARVVADLDARLIEKRAPAISIGATELGKESVLFAESWPTARRPPVAPSLANGVEIATREFDYALDGTQLRPERPRAEFLWRNRTAGLRFVINCPAPGEDRLAWGDYHFAIAMAEVLNRLGHRADVATRERWNARNSGADIAIHLRGIVTIEPVAGARNVMWLISHPDRVPSEEFAGCDLVFVASEPCKRYLHSRFGVSAVVVPQATDPQRFHQAGSLVAEVADFALFVGNSRMQARPIVFDAIQGRLPLAVYGGDWKPFIDPRFIKGDHVPNEELRDWYASAKVVLNDHWPAMQRFGIVSNRLFDVTAAGGIAISDPVDGIDELFEGHVRTYGSIGQLIELMRHLDDWRPSEAARETLSRKIRAEHSFEARVRAMLHHLSS